MKYIGLQSQKRRNNRKSFILLVLFPVLWIILVFTALHLFNIFSENVQPTEIVNRSAIRIIPFTLGGVAIWFCIAWFSHSIIIRNATGSKTLEREQNKRVYNLVENLCISQGIPVPQIFIIHDNSLNAFASGINRKTYSISLSQGIIDKLDDNELEGVIAHELTHIRNHDVRVLIISIIFVGIFAFLTEFAFRSLRYSGRGKKNAGVFIIIILALAAIGWLLSTIFRFAISRQREFLADAGAAELTKRPESLADALKKISSDSRIEAVERKDVAQLFIDHPLEKTGKLTYTSLFATHPPIEERIKILRQF